MRKKYNKEEIIAQGASLIRKQGYHNTGINDILKEVGIPKGSFYNFFSSKEEFGQMIVDHYGAGQRAWIIERFSEAGGSSLDRLRHLYTSILESNRLEEFRYGCLINNMSMETAGHNDRLALANKVQFESWLEEIAAVIKEGQGAEEIRTDYEALELADFLHSNLYGALSRGKMLRTEQALKRSIDMGIQFLEGN